MNTLGHHQSTPPPTLATRMLQVLPAVVSVISLASLSRYHWMRLHGPVEPKSLPQHLYIKLYESFGFAPSLLFFLLVAVWSVMWFTTGRLERPLGRLGRLAVMTVLLGVALNLGAGSVAPGPQKGELGAWLGSVLVGMVGYYPSLLLVWAATFGALLLATDFFFADSFERLWRARTTVDGEAGVEAGVTEHLQKLGSAVQAVPPASTDTSYPRPADPLPSSASFAAAVAAAAAAAEAQEGQSSDASAAEGASAAEARDGGDVSFSGSEAPVELEDADRPLSYQERRRLREARRFARFTAPDEAERSVPAVGENPPAPEAAAPEAAHDVDSSSEAPGGSHDEAPPAPVTPALEPQDRWQADSADADQLAVASAMDAPVVADGAGDAVDADDAVDVEPFDLDDESDRAEAGFETDDDEDAAAAAADDDVLHPSAPREPEPILASGDTAPWESEPPYVLPSAPPEPAPAALEDRAADGGSVEEAATSQGVPGSPPAEAPVEIPRGEPRPQVPEPEVDRAGGRQQSLFDQGLEEALVQEAHDLVVSARRASASFLQRKLRIDYQLAVDLLAELAARGVVALDGDATQGRVLA